jgi:hypothetical protein
MVEVKINCLYQRVLTPRSKKAKVHPVFFSHSRRQQAGGSTANKARDPPSALLVFISIRKSCIPIRGHVFSVVP